MKAIHESEMKEIEIQIMDAIHNFCIKNGLHYSIAYGSLIGAVRHKGIIPWDDDIDIVMHRDDYEVFVRQFNKVNRQFKALTVENTENFPYTFCKVVDVSTDIEEFRYKKYSGGVFVDVFPIDHVGDTLEECHKVNKKIHIYRRLLDYKMQRKSWVQTKKVLRFFVKLVLVPVSHKALIHKIIKLSTQKNSIDTKYSANLTFVEYGEGEFLPTKKISDYVLLDFEDRKYYAFQSYDMVLTQIYGDYMKLPPVEKRVTHHSFQVYKKEQ